MTRTVFPLTQRQLVANLARVYKRATDNDIVSGIVWYPTANDIARDLASKYDVDMETAAGVIAAYSPQTMWSVNVKAAEMILATGEQLPSTLYTNYVRALNVIRGTVTADMWSPRSAPKIRAFYYNILGNENVVTVDVWAFRAAFNDVDADAKILRRVGAYATISQAYRTLAKRLGMTPATLQAIIWTTYRRETMADRMNDRLGR